MNKDPKKTSKSVMECAQADGFALALTVSLHKRQWICGETLESSLCKMPL